MKRLIPVFGVLLIVALVLAPMFDATAQVKVKKIGRSLNQMTLPVKGSPAPAWNISTGLRAVGTKSRAYWTVDTLGSAQVGTPTWTLVTKPAGSAATLDSANGKWINSVKVDTVGEYIVSAQVGTQTAYDTIWASTYVGVSTDANAGCFCHPGATTIKTAWEKSVHGTMFFRSMTGHEEMERGKGAYAAGCIKCHTTGWDPTAANNNFGIKVKQSGWDTTWYKGLESYAGDYWITTGDSSKWNLLTADEKKLGNIGCESCHGPAQAHATSAQATRIGMSKYSPDMCNQCHDGSRRHSLGTFFHQSKHNEVEIGAAAEGGRANCQPCHVGAGLMYYFNNNMDTTGIASKWVLSRDAMTSISCQVCHDPHGNDNEFALRTMTLKGDSLKGGYVLPAQFRSSTGNICMICHGGRYAVKARITKTAPYYGWADRFYPHYNTQGEMLFGAGAYQYDDNSFTGLMTHAGVEGGCVGCHMQDRKNRLDGGGNMLANHSFSMSDTLFAAGVYKPTDACAPCHGEIEDFDDIRALYDYDRDGAIEGVQSEVDGLLAALKAKLPLDAVTNMPVTMRKDSLAVKNRPDLIQNIWNWYFVYEDRSKGVHNTKYAVRILYKALGWTPLAVEATDGMPTEFGLNQNYPNPFNPTTSISFSMPKDGHVLLQVYDVTGALVKTLVDQTMRAGNMQAAWDGTNLSGNKVASGVYLYRMAAGDFVAAKKMVLMK
ncbi:MAG: T9SS type A sorting domain-containing protein [Ignavibacteriae bacterium]|nr:T9SS type A sorting domain-containing protein [Ignavibacteriota bacterium]